MSGGSEFGRPSDAPAKKQQRKSADQAQKIAEERAAEQQKERAEEAKRISEQKAAEQQRKRSGRQPEGNAGQKSRDDREVRRRDDSAHERNPATGEIPKRPKKESPRRRSEVREEGNSSRGTQHPKEQRQKLVQERASQEKTGPSTADRKPPKANGKPSLSGSKGTSESAKRRDTEIDGAWGRRAAKEVIDRLDKFTDDYTRRHPSGQRRRSASSKNRDSVGDLAKTRAGSDAGSQRDLSIRYNVIPRGQKMGENLCVWDSAAMVAKHKEHVVQLRFGPVRQPLDRPSGKMDWPNLKGWIAQQSRRPSGEDRWRMLLESDVQETLSARGDIFHTGESRETFLRVAIAFGFEKAKIGLSPKGFSDALKDFGPFAYYTTPNAKGTWHTVTVTGIGAGRESGVYYYDPDTGNAHHKSFADFTDKFRPEALGSGKQRKVWILHLREGVGRTP